MVIRDFRPGDIGHQLIRLHFPFPSYAKLHLNATGIIPYWVGASDNEISGSTWWKITFFCIRIQTFSKIVASKNPKNSYKFVTMYEASNMNKGTYYFLQLNTNLSHSSLLCTVLNVYCTARVLWLPDPEDTLYYPDILAVILAFDSVPSSFIHSTSNKALHLQQKFTKLTYPSPSKYSFSSFLFIPYSTLTTPTLHFMKGVSHLKDSSSTKVKFHCFERKNH